MGDFWRSEDVDVDVHSRLEERERNLKKRDEMFSISIVVVVFIDKSTG